MTLTSHKIQSKEVLKKDKKRKKARQLTKKDSDGRASGGRGKERNGAAVREMGRTHDIEMIGNLEDSYLAPHPLLSPLNLFFGMDFSTTSAVRVARVEGEPLTTAVERR